MNRPECIITGCIFFSPQEGRYVNGDLFKLGSTYIHNACMVHDPGPMNVAWQYSVPSHGQNVIVAKGAAYFEKRGVIVFDEAVAEMNDAAWYYLDKHPEFRPGGQERFNGRAAMRREVTAEDIRRDQEITDYMRRGTP